MAKALTFAEKAAKIARRESEITCPKCNKKGKLLHAKYIRSVLSGKNTWKFQERNVRICSNCQEEI